MSSATTISDGERRPLTGIAGWLALLALGQTFTTLRLLLNAFQDWDSLKPYFARLGAVSAAYGDVFGDGALLLMSLFVTVWFWRKKRSFPVLFTAQWVILVLWPVAQVLYVSAMLNISPTSLLASQIGQSVGAWFAGLIWVIYVYRSRRVKNTFVR